MPDDERRPNLTVSDPNTEPSALPRDPSQKIHKKPRVFIHRASEDPEEEERAYKNLSMLDAAKTVSIEDFKKVHQTPCFRDAMLPGIGLGSGVGALRFVVGGMQIATASVVKANADCCRIVPNRSEFRRRLGFGCGAWHVSVLSRQTAEG